jgi:hypothetical protein
MAGVVERMRHSLIVGLIMALLVPGAAGATERCRDYEPVRCDAQSGRFVAYAVGDGYLLITGVFVKGGDSPASVDDLSSIAGIIAIERYTPVPDPARSKSDAGPLTLDAVRKALNLPPLERPSADRDKDPAR